MKQCLPEPECPFCDVKLMFSDKHGYYKCHDCGGEWWPADAPDDGDISVLWRDEQAYKRRLSKKGGGRREVGRKKVKKPLNTERYRLE